MLQNATSDQGLHCLHTGWVVVHASTFETLPFSCTHLPSWSDMTESSIEKERKKKEKERKKETGIFIKNKQNKNEKVHQTPLKRQMSLLMTKPTKCHVRPAKTQISLGILPVWLESSLSAWRKLGSLATHWAHSEDSDQTGSMPRLIWVFAGRTCHFVGFVMKRLKWTCPVCNDGRIH